MWVIISSTLLPLIHPTPHTPQYLSFWRSHWCIVVSCCGASCNSGTNIDRGADWLQLIIHVCWTHTGSACWALVAQTSCICANYHLQIGSWGGGVSNREGIRGGCWELMVAIINPLKKFVIMCCHECDQVDQFLTPYPIHFWGWDTLHTRIISRKIDGLLCVKPKLKVGLAKPCIMCLPKIKIHHKFFFTCLQLPLTFKLLS